MKIQDRVVELRRVPASSLRPNPKNWRKHPRQQADALRGTLAEIGFAEAIVARELADGTLEIIDGHLRAETVGEAQVPVLVLDVTEDEADKLLATLDPIAAMAESDAEALAALVKTIETDNEALQKMLDDLAADSKLLDGQSTPVENPYTAKVEAPIYKPKGERPPISELTDTSKATELCREILDADLPSELQSFLIAAAQRHVVFNFRNIAEYYCHATPQVQHLMERSGLVIIDFNKAIQYGFVHLTDRLASIVDLETGEDETDA